MISEDTAINEIKQDEGTEDLLFETGRDIVRKILNENPSNENVLSMAVEACRFAEFILEKVNSQQGEPQPIDCKAGCPYCCSMQISITPPEALVLGAYVSEIYTKEEQEVLLDKISHNQKLTSGKSLDEKVINWHDTPCIFLKDGSCSVYEIRPFICRSWHSLNAEDCIDAYNKKDPGAVIDSLPHRNYIFGTIRDGLQEGIKEAGCQWETVIITDGVKAYLDHEDPVTAWIKGEDVF